MPSHVESFENQRSEEGESACPSVMGRSNRINKGWWGDRLVVAVSLPVVLFVALRPERFGLTPNSLDPFFYTGYATNFDDILREVGDSHYFVTRWSVYSPGRVFGWFVGPYWGRIAVRWLVATLILLSLWHLGRRWSWTRSTELLIGVVALTMPIFARAFMTDYTEWLFSSVGIILVCQCLETRSVWWRSLLIGTLGALIVIANPFGVSIILWPGLIYVINASRIGKHAVLQTVFGFAGFAGTILAGLLVYRLFYDIPNVYQPSIDFTRQIQDVRDPLKSPRLTWMGAFTWIYAPLLLLAVCTLGPVRNRLRQFQMSASILVMLTMQYAFQVWDQFIRDGNGLEISYYWSFITPAFVVALALLLGAYDWTYRSAAIVLAIWLTILTTFSLGDVSLPAGWAFIAIAVGTFISIAVISSHHLHLGLACTLAALLIWQVGSPGYDPFSYHDFNMDPHYNRVFFERNSIADQSFQEAVWLEDRLDELPSDVDVSFYARGQAIFIVGIYGPHVTGMIINDLTAQAFRLRVALGLAGLVVVYGPEDQVTGALDVLGDYSTTGNTLMDSVNPGGLAYRLVVKDYSTVTEELLEFPASFFPSQSGELEDGGEGWVVRPGRDEPGFVTYGPYVPIDESPMRVEFTYRSDLAPNETDGFFDIIANGDSLASAELAGTNGQLGTVVIDFVGAGADDHQFRSFWGGRSSVTIESVSFVKRTN